MGKQLPLFKDGIAIPDYLPHPHVSVRPGGGAFVEGTNVPVCRLFYFHKRGVPVQTLLRRYPRLEAAAVLSALSFAYDNEALVAHHAESLGVSPESW
jgi:uncharacterized protein (DUF433 family)